MADRVDKELHQDVFLREFCDCGNITEAARRVGIERKQHYRWLDSDPEYPKRFEDAMQTAADNLEAEARRRAVRGVAKPVFYKGEQCGEVQEYSDVLLIFLLKGALPDKYADRSKVDANMNVKPVVFAGADELED